MLYLMLFNAHNHNSEHCNVELLILASSFWKRVVAIKASKFTHDIKGGWFLKKLWCCVGGSRNDCLVYQQTLITKAS